MAATITSPSGPSQQLSAAEVFKRALYSVFKRALIFFKRAPPIPAIKCGGGGQKSPILFVQKSPVFCFQKGLIYFQKGPTHPCNQVRQRYSKEPYIPSKEP